MDGDWKTKIFISYKSPLLTRWFHGSSISLAVCSGAPGTGSFLCDNTWRIQVLRQEVKGAADLIIARSLERGIKPLSFFDAFEAFWILSEYPRSQAAPTSSSKTKAVPHAQCARARHLLIIDPPGPSGS
jgi:hypothetical protein